jgi:hypothetical protein
VSARPGAPEDLPNEMLGDLLVAGGSVLALVGRVEVAQRWSDPSALPEMTVGALAVHLGDQVLTAHRAVTAGAGASSEKPVTLLEHYDRVPWLGAPLDEPANVAIREQSAQAADSGHGALVTALTDALEDLRTARHGRQRAPLPPAVRLPHWDWSISFDDFLLTRTMEMVVHSDDLAVSVGVDPPGLPQPVLGPVLALLVGVSLRRHGQAAVVRALSRSERAGDISAF